MENDLLLLKRLYLDFLEDTSPQTIENCPPPEILLNLIRAKVSTSEKKNVLDHVTNCVSCVRELKFILKTMSCENQINREIEILLHKDKK